MCKNYKANLLFYNSNLMILKNKMLRTQQLRNKLILKMNKSKFLKQIMKHSAKNYKFKLIKKIKMSKLFKKKLINANKQY